MNRRAWKVSAILCQYVADFIEQHPAAAAFAFRGAMCGLRECAELQESEDLKEAKKENEDLRTQVYRLQQLNGKK